MNITIFTGGTGSISLQQGIKSIYPAAKINCIVNAYDDGKSTGTCRRVFNVLGPSDIRKNHYTQYMNKLTPDKKVEEFFTSRVDLSNKTKNEIKEILVNTFNPLKKHSLLLAAESINFFVDNLDVEKEQENLKDFNIANIFYAGAMQYYSQNEENSIQNFISEIARIFELEDNVILNSEENLYLTAKTRKGTILDSEGQIVSWDHESDIIDEVFFVNHENSQIAHFPVISDLAKKTIEESDLIIYSAGTQWSSLIPTYKTIGLNSALSKTRCPKILIVNNVIDYDMTGLSFGGMIKTILRYLDVDNVDYFLFNSQSENIEAIDELCSSSISSKFVKFTIPIQNSTKHDSVKLAAAIFETFAHCLVKGIDRLYFDFDDTLWARDPKLELISRENMLLIDEISKKKKVTIVSGNDYNNSIKPKLEKVFGSKLKEVKFDLFSENGIFKRLPIESIALWTAIIIQPVVTSIELYLKKYLIGKFEKNELTIEYGKLNNIIGVIKIKKLDPIVRELLCDLANIEFKNTPIFARKTGHATLDFMNSSNTKDKVLNSYSYNENSLYVGDEIDFGNDESIARRCSDYYKVKNVFDTNVFLKSIINEMQNGNW